MDEFSTHRQRFSVLTNYSLETEMLNGQTKMSKVPNSLTPYKSNTR